MLKSMASVKPECSFGKMQYDRVSCSQVPHPTQYNGKQSQTVQGMKSSWSKGTGMHAPSKGVNNAAAID